MKTRHILLLTALMTTAAACGTPRHMGYTSAATEAIATPHAAKTSDAEGLRFMQRVADNALYQKNLVAGIDFTLERNGSKISVPGILRMRKDNVIRLQLLIPFVRTEVGRMEFTPEGVLFVDRLHHQYVKASYAEVDFLRDNGITFYSLQALFWNQLLLPGEQKVGESQLKAFTPDLEKGETVPVRLHDGKMDYEWSVDKGSAQIRSALITYKSAEHGTSTLRWQYDDFQGFGSKQYPRYHDVTAQTSATGKPMTIRFTLSLNDIKADNNWDSSTSLSGKYKQVPLEEVLEKLIQL